MEVRKAFIMGVYREGLIRTVRTGYGRVVERYPTNDPLVSRAEVPCPVPEWCDSSNMKSARGHAKEVLAKGGFDFGRTYLDIMDIPGKRALADAIEEQQGLLGVKSRIDTSESLRQGSNDEIHFRIVEEELRFPSRFRYDYDQYRANTAPDVYQCQLIRDVWDPDIPCKEIVWTLAFQIFEKEPHLPGSENVVRLLIKINDASLYRQALEQYAALPLYWEGGSGAAFWPEVRGCAHSPTSAGSFRKFLHMWINPDHRDDAGNSGQVSGVPGGL